MSSALEIEFLVHYRELDLRSGKWNGARIRRLCNLLNLTQPELARLLRVSPHGLKKYIETEKWPGCLKLLLSLIERGAGRTYLGTTYSEPLFPIEI